MAVLVAALGYFVDIYDLILFGIVRRPSLTALGVPEGQLLSEGLFLQNVQMVGLIVGGVMWGVIADRRGRLSVLFASIITYSLANIANGFVQDIPQYAVARFVAGVGLAGELGAGITLVSELMDKTARGWGTTIVATIGISGGVVAGLVGGAVDWRTAYFIGGGLGLALLALRIGVTESGLFDQVKEQRDVKRGDFRLLLRSRKRVMRYLAVIAVGVPIWYAVGILFTSSPELGAYLGVSPKPVAARSFLWGYAGLAVGDLASGAISQLVRSRRKAIGMFLALAVLGVTFYFTLGARSQGWFYAGCAILGFATGYWAVFVTSAAEQFGTNLRGTVATTAPNLVRGSVPLMAIGFGALTPALGLAGAAVAVGVVAFAIAGAALWILPETYGKDLDFLED